MAISAIAAPKKNYEIASPDGKLQVSINVNNGISYTLKHDGDLLLDDSKIAVTFTDGTTFDGVQNVKKAETRSVSQVLETEIYKKAQVKDEFNELTLKFKTFSLVFRAYDDGMAYRFVSHLKEPLNVDGEIAQFNFAKDWNMWAAYVCQHTETLESQYYNSFENQYSYTPLSQWNKDRLAFLPLMVDGPKGKKIVITEADLMNYPGMYLYNGNSDKVLEAVFAPYPEEVKQGGHNNLQMEVQTRKPYIAPANFNHLLFIL